MLHETAAALRHGIAPAWERNAILEAFALHGRVLVDFLWTPIQRRHFPTDILAADYFDPPETWRLPNESLPIPLRPLSRRANTQMAHLSYRRVGRAAEPWLQSDMAELLSTGMRLFVKEALPHGRLDTGLDWGFLVAEPEPADSAQSSVTA